MFNLAGIFLPVYILLQYLPISIDNVFSILIMSALPSGILLLTANYFPDIEVDENNIYVSFIWMRLSIPLDDLITIKPTFFSRLLKPSSPAIWVVATQWLSPFHILYGLLYGFWWYPSFIIHSEIENFKDLRSFLHRRIRS